MPIFVLENEIIRFQNSNSSSTYIETITKEQTENSPNIKLIGQTQFPQKVRESPTSESPIVDFRGLKLTSKVRESSAKVRSIELFMF